MVHCTFSVGLRQEQEITEQEKKHRMLVGHHSESLRKENEKLRNELESLKRQLESQTRVGPKQVNRDVSHTEAMLVPPAQASGTHLVSSSIYNNILLCNVCSRRV